MNKTEFPSPRPPHGRRGWRARALLAVWISLLTLLLAPRAHADEAYVRAHYIKYECTIPMRDGVRLFTTIYIPKDSAQKYPILLNRSPYSVAPYGLDKYRSALGPTEAFEKEGYIFAYQDVRGKVLSEGRFVDMRPEQAWKSGGKSVDESTDTYDTIDWLTECIPNNTGEVGMWGISYPGFYTAVGAINGHPRLKAISPQAPIADWFLGDDFHHNGALMFMDAFGFFNGFGPAREAPSTEWPAPAFSGMPDSNAYQFYLDIGPLPNVNAKYFHHKIAFWDDLMQHGTYDAFWQARNVLPNLKNITAAVLTVGGWFDAEDFYGPLHIYQTIERTRPGLPNTIVIGPWQHGGWAHTQGNRLGGAFFGSDTSLYFQNDVQLPFFNYYLKGKGSFNAPEALLFVTGTNTWKSFREWPPKTLQSKSLYFRADHKLAFDAPTETGAETADSYVSDPANPVPYTADKGIGRTTEYMTEDQRFLAGRPDVLTYQSEPLSEDTTLAGPITASLFVSTTGTDADFVVKLIDAFPDDKTQLRDYEASMTGYQMLVRGDVMRGRFRQSFSRPEAFTPSKVTEVSFTLNDICHTFRKGHRILVQVQSSWFPLVDRNPQTFVDIYNARESDFQKATQRIYRSSQYPSRLRVGVLPKE